MTEEFDKEFIKLSKKDQSTLLNLLKFKKMFEEAEYKQRIDKAIKYIKENNYYLDLPSFQQELIEILKGVNNE